MPSFTQAEVEYLIRAKKFVFRTVENNTDWERKRSPGSRPPTELRITYDIRRKDTPSEPAHLQFHARKELGSPLAKWGTSLRWSGERIRGIDYKYREDIIRNGLIAGKIRHWHEHVWTDADGDKNIIDVNAVVKNEDMRSMIELCMDRWSIEGYGHQYRLEDV